MLASLPVLIARPRYCVSASVRFANATPLARFLSLFDLFDTRFSELRITSFSSLTRLSVTTPRDSTTSTAGSGTAGPCGLEPTEAVADSLCVASVTAVVAMREVEELDPTEAVAEPESVVGAPAAVSAVAVPDSGVAELAEAADTVSELSFPSTALRPLLVPPYVPNAEPEADAAEGAEAEPGIISEVEAKSEAEAEAAANPLASPVSLDAEPALNALEEPKFTSAR